jgi:hypothetical protein
MVRIPHLRDTCVIVPGQLIHISVDFKNKDYVPRAIFREDKGIEWKSFVRKQIGSGDFAWTMHLATQLEMDLFDPSFTIDAVQRLKELWEKVDTSTRYESGPDKHDQGPLYCMERLAFMALSG